MAAGGVEVGGEATNVLKVILFSGLLLKFSGSEIREMEGR